MPPSTQSRIFISYARRQGAGPAGCLQSDLTEKGFEVWLDTDRPASGAAWGAEITPVIGRIDVRGIAHDN
jgi:hypothetical protein